MKRTTAIVNIATIVMLSALLGVANGVALSNSGLITTYLGGKSVDYNTTEAQNARTEGKALAVELVENGAVLLKNENHCLPLTKPEINIFGWSGSDNGFLYQGGGSSEGGYSADKVSLYQAFRNAGFAINEDLASAYNGLSYRREGAADSDQWSTYYRLYEPGEDFYTEERMSQAKNFSDTAVVVFSRRATEGDDLPKCQYDENGKEDDSRDYLALSDKEGVMLAQVCAAFEKVICLFDGSAPMEMGFLNYDGIDAALHVGYPGYYGTAGIVNILDGAVNPSGHMADTCAYDITTAPSYVNSGNLDSHIYADRGGRYTDYLEDIYVGYKWYETADAEGYWNGATLNSFGHAKSNYDAVVQYPFGFGLSYTSFSWTLESIKVNDTLYSASTTLKPGDTLSFKVWVENTGSVPGKDVVQLYYGAPYTKGGIEKSAINLIDFQKTATLPVGQGEELTLSARASDLTSYDAYDKNNNGFMGYELEQGRYAFSLRSDVHTVKELADGSKANYELNVGEDYQVDKDPDTGNVVENRFTTYTNPISFASSVIAEPQATYAISIDGHDDNKAYDQGLTYLSRSNFATTYPASSGKYPQSVTSVRAMSKLMLDNVFKVHAPFIDPNDTMPTTGSSATSYTLDDVAGLPYDDPKWTALIEQLDVNTLGDISAGGGFGTIAVPSINKPRTTDSDGGTGFTSGVSSGSEGHCVKYPSVILIAQSFDWKEAYKWGHAIGTEGQAYNIQGWYAPGCNVHRSPLGGRNFEYFSEDGRLAGVMVGWTIKGCTENGVYAYMKHFAANDTDAGRNGQFRWMSEQSLREIYAKPGELAVKIGQANALMASVDRIGSVRTTGSYALLTAVLRGEWGFRGSCITDYYQSGNVNDIDEGIRAGNDLVLFPGKDHTLFDDLNSATTVKALQNAAHNILYTYVSTLYRTKTATGVDLNSNIGTRSTDDATPTWQIILFSVDGGVGAGLLAWLSLSIYLTWLRKARKGVQA